MAEPTATRSSTGATPYRFVAAFAAWSLGLFGLSRLPWVEQSVVLPFAAVQQQLAGVLAGPAAGAVLVDASCTATDVLALCAGAILAYPAT